MPSPNQNSREMQAWLKQANEAHFTTETDFGEFDSDGYQGNPTSGSITAAGRDVSSDGSLDGNN